MQRFSAWLENRTGLPTLVHKALYEHVPGGARWRYVWGSTLVFVFFVQLVTGLFLWMHYSPSAQTAWESVYYIEHELTGGWLVRGVHHYAAQAMIVLLALHVMQVVIDGAYKAPREVNFWLGIVLMLLVMGLALTGYLLPWDQKGYWATQVATKIISSAPLVGEELQTLVVGGHEYGHQTLTRFFALHAGLLPALLVAVLVAHLALFRRHSITPKLPLKRPDSTFWPDQVLKDGVACLAVLATLLGLTWYFRAELGAPANPAEPYDAARPEWYFLFLFQFLKHFHGEHGIRIGAIYIPAAVLLFMFLMPFLGRVRLGHWVNVAFLFLLMIGAGWLTFDAIHEDYRARWTNSDGASLSEHELVAHEKSQTYLDAVESAHSDAVRARELAAQGIPPAGALWLLENDPKTQGPKLFRRHCASCHSYEPLVSAGAASTDSIIAEESTASNLYRFASREWLAGMLDPEQIISPHYFGNTPFRDGEMVQFVQDNIGEFRRDMEGEELEEFDAEVEDVVIALSAEAALVYQQELDARDAERIDRGRTAMVDAFSCTTCHKFRNQGDLGMAPDLTDYGSRQWLIDFIADPGHGRFYSESNVMPAFHDNPDTLENNKLTRRELELLVDWLRGEWYRLSPAKPLQFRTTEADIPR